MVNDYHGLGGSANVILGACEQPGPGAYLALSSEGSVEGLAAVAARGGGANEVEELLLDYGPFFALPGQTRLCTKQWSDVTRDEKKAVANYFATNIPGALRARVPCSP